MTNKQVKAKGFAYNDTDPNVKIAVTMPREDFNWMRAQAIAKNCSISAIIREYVSVGIEVDKDMGE